MIQLAPEFLGGFKDVRIFGFFVDADELAVEHESLAGGDGGLHWRPVMPKIMWPSIFSSENGVNGL